MYNEKMAAAIKVNTRVLREFKDVVYLPFSAEYAVYLKNLNTVRATVRIFIDGKDMLDGKSVIVDPGKELTVERSIKNGNLTEGNKFKFIERTATIEKHKGIGIEDGIVRIEYQYEKVPPKSIPTPRISPWPQQYPFYEQYGSGATYATTTLGSVASKGITRGIQGSSLNDVGITVPGSHSTQQFTQGSYFPVEDTKHNIIFKLLGETADNKQVNEPVTVKYKPECETCGRVNKITSKFCSECGTSLNIIK